MVLPTGSIGPTRKLALALTPELTEKLREVAAAEGEIDPKTNLPNPHPNTLRRILQAGCNAYFGEQIKEYQEEDETIKLARDTNQRVKAIEKVLNADP